MLKRNNPSIFPLVLRLENKEWEKLINNLMKQGILRSPHVIKAMQVVPRAKFLPPNLQSYSAVDTPLSIGFGQTISAPHSLSFALG
jgi:protein-L-isoaspartate(D-aspartate) O-methyltransferase